MRRCTTATGCRSEKAEMRRQSLDCRRWRYLRLSVLEVSFLPLGFPCRKLPLALLALVKREDVRQEASGELLNFMLRDVGVVYELLPTTQFLPPM